MADKLVGKTQKVRLLSFPLLPSLFLFPVPSPASRCPLAPSPSTASWTLSTVLTRRTHAHTQVAGKMTHNPELHEKGELREAGGKLAAQGRARAPHD